MTPPAEAEAANSGAVKEVRCMADLHHKETKALVVCANWEA